MNTAVRRRRLGGSRRLAGRAVRRRKGRQVWARAQTTGPKALRRESGPGARLASGAARRRRPARVAAAGCRRRSGRGEWRRSRARWGRGAARRRCSEVVECGRVVRRRGRSGLAGSVRRWEPGRPRSLRRRASPVRIASLRTEALVRLAMRTVLERAGCRSLAGNCRTARRTASPVRGARTRMPVPMCLAGSPMAARLALDSVARSRVARSTAMSVRVARAPGWARAAR